MTLSVVPNAAIAETTEQIADRLERTAALLRNDAYGSVTRAVVVLQVEEGVFVRTYGRPQTNNELIGFLTCAVNDLVTGNDLQTD